VNPVAGGPPLPETPIVEIFEPDVHDDKTVAELLDLHRAVHSADEPDSPPPCSVAFPVGLRLSWPGNRTVHRVVYADGRIVGHLDFGVPTMDNLHLAGASVRVHPGYRRRGIGRALMTAGFGLAEAEGRTTFMSGACTRWEDGPQRSEAGVRFLSAMGFEHALTEVLRRMDVGDLDPQVEQRLYEEAVAKAEGYEIVRWIGRTPEEIIAGLAELNSIFLDEAPTGSLEFERERIDADRHRRTIDNVLASGIFMSSAVARHRASGRIVANTVIGVRTEPGDVGEQWITLVDPEHRGHRLGMLVKLENLRQLRMLRPGVRRIETGNADVNAHMIAINDALGFYPYAAWAEYQRKL
jgi:GNAT superfamily N-acetyltransferase